MLLDGEFFGSGQELDPYFVAFLDLGVDNHLGKLVFKILLNGAFERAGAILGVIAFVGQEITRLVSDVERVAELFQTFFETGELDVDNLEYRFAAQRVKHDYIVDAVEELGRECLVQRFLQHAVAVLLVSVRGSVESDAGPEVFELSRPDVGGHDNQGVLEIDAPPEAVGQTPLVHHL